MQSSLISKIQKASLYAREPDRVTFTELSTTFRGENDTYNVALHDAQWSCNCHFFKTNGICSHIMAVQKILAEMLTHDARYWQGSEALAAGAGNGASH